jgi:hypothetical protein
MRIFSDFDQIKSAVGTGIGVSACVTELIALHYR